MRIHKFVAVILREQAGDADHEHTKSKTTQLHLIPPNDIQTYMEYFVERVYHAVCMPQGSFSQIPSESPFILPAAIFSAPR